MGAVCKAREESSDPPQGVVAENEEIHEDEHPRDHHVDEAEYDSEAVAHLIKNSSD